MSIGPFTLNIFGQNRQFNEEFIALFFDIDDAIITGILISKDNEIVKIYDGDGVLIEKIKKEKISCLKSKD